MSYWPGLRHDKVLFVDGERLCEGTCKALLVQGKPCPGPQIASLLLEDSMGPKGKGVSEDGGDAEENFSVNKTHCAC